jgi:hypothetical protein
MCSCWCQGWAEINIRSPTGILTSNQGKKDQKYVPMILPRNVGLAQTQNRKKNLKKMG